MNEFSECPLVATLNAKVNTVRQCIELTPEGMQAAMEALIQVASSCRNTDCICFYKDPVSPEFQ